MEIGSSRFCLRMYPELGDELKKLEHGEDQLFLLILLLFASSVRIGV